MSIQPLAGCPVIDVSSFIAGPYCRILDELAPVFDFKGYVRQCMGPGTMNVVPHSHYPTYSTTTATPPPAGPP